VGEDPARARGLDLEPGRYEFSATLPSGSVVSQTVDVGATQGPVYVALDAGASPHEWLAWQQWSGNVSEQPIQRVRELQSARAIGEPIVSRDTVDVGLWTTGRASSATHDPVWEKLSTVLSNLDRERTVDPTMLFTASDAHDMINTRSDPPYLAAQLPLAGGEPGRSYLFVEIAGRSMLCAMPWPWTQLDGSGDALVEAVITIDEKSVEQLATVGPEAGVEPTWSVRPAVRDRMLGGILAYFASGEQAAARELLAPAREMLRGKRLNPFGAAGGAYVLVAGWIGASVKGSATEASESPSSWMSWVGNLSRMFPWLPDGAILEGWLALRMRDREPRLDEARVALLEAERRGVPVYTAGVRRLVDGLLLLSGEARRSGTPDDEVDAALVRVRRLAWQIDPEQPFTCVRLWPS
jgi:hypothetical protein